MRERGSSWQRDGTSLSLSPSFSLSFFLCSRAGYIDLVVRLTRGNTGQGRRRTCKKGERERESPLRRRLDALLVFLSRRRGRAGSPYAAQREREGAREKERERAGVPRCMRFVVPPFTATCGRALCEFHPLSPLFSFPCFSLSLPLARLLARSLVRSTFPR